MPGFVRYPTKRGLDYTCAGNHPSGRPGLSPSRECPNLGDLPGAANGGTAPGQLPPQGIHTPPKSGGPRGNRYIRGG